MTVGRSTVVTTVQYVVTMTPFTCFLEEETNMTVARAQPTEDKSLGFTMFLPNLKKPL